MHRLDLKRYCYRLSCIYFEVGIPGLLIMRWVGFYDS
jgi:hypothetical protein